VYIAHKNVLRDTILVLRSPFLCPMHIDFIFRLKVLVKLLQSLISGIKEIFKIISVLGSIPQQSGLYTVHGCALEIRSIVHGTDEGNYQREVTGSEVSIHIIVTII